MKRSVRFEMTVGSYSLFIERDTDDPDMLRFSLSWNDNGRVQHEGLVPVDEFAAAIVELTED